MRNQRNEVEPKPFALVEIPSDEPKRTQVTTHERFQGLTGKLELTLIVESEYLFVGSGGYEFNPNSKGDQPDVWHTFYRRNGQICIPGTTIKGAIRSIVEAISNSCVSLSRPHEVKLTQLDRAHSERCNSLEKACPACRLFGFTGLRGRVSLEDAPVIGPDASEIIKIPEMWHHDPKKIQKLDKARRFYENKKFMAPPNLRPDRGYWFVEAVPKGTQFRTILHFENMSQSELGLLFHSLGWQAGETGIKHAFTPKLGGAKPRCFGAVKFTPVRLQLWSGNDFSVWLQPQVKQGEEMVHFVVECLKACMDSELIHRKSWENLVQALQPKNETCPRGIY